MKITAAMTVAVVLHWAIGSAGAIADKVATHSLADSRHGHGRPRRVARGHRRSAHPEGAAPAGSRFLLYDQDHRQVPCQHAVLARGRTAASGGSCSISRHGRPENGSSHFQLKWTRDAAAAHPALPVTVSREKGLSIASGAVELATVDGALCGSRSGWICSSC